MKYEAIPAFPAGSAATAAVPGVTIPSESVVTLSVVGIATGTPVGSLQIQVSNDPVPTAAQVVNWATPTGVYAIAISAAGIVSTSIPDFCWKWARVNYVFTSGTGTISANVKTVGF